MVAKIMGPQGDVWASAPDGTWSLRGEPWPAVGKLVEVCWSSRKKDPARYTYGKAVLVKEYWDGPHNMSEWHNEAGSLLALNPDFWRPIPADETPA